MNIDETISVTYISDSIKGESIHQLYFGGKPYYEKKT